MDTHEKEVHKLPRLLRARYGIRGLPAYWTRWMALVYSPIALISAASTERMLEWGLTIPGVLIVTFFGSKLRYRRSLDVPLEAEKDLEILRDTLKSLEGAYNLLEKYEDATLIEAPKESLAQARNLYNQLVTMLSEIEQKDKDDLLTQQQVKDLVKRHVDKVNEALNLLQEDFTNLIEEQRNLRLLSMKAAREGLLSQESSCDESVGSLLRTRAALQLRTESTKKARKELEEVFELKNKARAELKTQESLLS